MHPLEPVTESGIDSGRPGNGLKGVNGFHNVRPCGHPCEEGQFVLEGGV
jgi:hypothetical protein